MVGGRVSAMTLIGKKKLHSDAHTTRFGKNMLAMQRRSDMVDLHLLKYLGSSLADFHISTLLAFTERGPTFQIKAWSSHSKS